jgi:F0F1-type ATP synthase membrane subunit b/b'
MNMTIATVLLAFVMIIALPPIENCLSKRQQGFSESGFVVANLVVKREMGK